MTELTVGDRTPDFTASSIRGGQFTLSSNVRKTPVLLYFYPVNFGMTCTKYIAQMNEMFDDFDNIGIKMFHLNPDPTDVLTEWMDRTESKYDHIFDEDQKISKTHGMIVTHPEHPKVSGFTNRGFVLVDRDMVIRYLWRADRPNDTVDLRTLIDNIRGILR